jgi:hypothetical protein
MLALLLVTTLIGYNHAYKKRLSNEKLSSVDMYKVHEYSEENSNIVMKALASGSSDKLAKNMINSEDAAAVMEFAEWKKADFIGR